MKKLTMLTALLVLAAFSTALSGFVKTFNDNYKVNKDSNIGKAACMTCHTTAKGGKLNPYGQDLMAAMKAADTKKLTPEILKKVEPLDSNKNGVKNIDEIKADKLPGQEKPQ